MKCRNIVAVLALPTFVLSCTRLAPSAPPETATPQTEKGELLTTLQESEQRELLKAASHQLDVVRKHLKKGDTAAAEAALQPLVGQSLFVEEIDALEAEIAFAKKEQQLDIAQAQTDKTAMSEVEQRLVLPESYNTTVVIEGAMGPVAIPKGPMEDLFSRRVDINVQNAGVKELIEALTKIEGLNIIADEALEAQNALTINVRNTPLTEILSYIARNMGIAFHLGENVVWVTESQEEPGSGPKLETQVYHLRHGFVPTLDSGGGDPLGGGGAAGEEDTDLEDALTAALTDSPDGATYRIFKHRNLLMVKDTRENLRLVEQLLEEFDKTPKQVLIEARFITIGQDDLRDVGVELAQTSTPDPLQTTDPTSGRVSNVISTALFGGDAASMLDGKPKEFAQLALGGVIADRTFDVVLSAIEERSSTRTLSAPRVTVLNNHMARIRRGDKVLYYDELETVAASGGDVNGDGNTQTAFSGTPKELELGVTLEVKVNIGNDGQTIMLGMAPEVIELKQWRQFNVVAGSGDNTDTSGSSTTDAAPGQLELPETTESTVTTSVAVRSGETVVLGGLVSVNRQTDVKKVPFLGDLPVIGFFFRRTTEKDVPSHLLIFVTASILDDAGRFVKVQDGGE